MRINQLESGKFSVTHNGELIEICRDIEAADQIVNACHDEHLADWEAAKCSEQKG